jgi:hypothetical protein
MPHHVIKLEGHEEKREEEVEKIVLKEEVALH